MLKHMGKCNTYSVSEQKANLEKSFTYDQRAGKILKTLRHGQIKRAKATLEKFMLLDWSVDEYVEAMLAELGMDC